ncbi:MAG: hypothetical protein ACYTGL_03050 [Planctomycetota bacterium]|jgi:hypothetical protein
MSDTERTFVWWLLLVIAGLYSIYILIELTQAKTTSFKRFGFGDSVGGETITRRNEPIRYWLTMTGRSGALVGLWLCWWML